MPICTVLLCWRLGTNSRVVSLTLYRHVRAAPGSADAPADTADTGGCGSAAAATPRDATPRANRAALSLRQVIANIASGPLRALGLYSAVMRIEHGMALVGVNRAGPDLHLYVMVLGQVKHARRRRRRRCAMELRVAAVCLRDSFGHSSPG